MFGLQKEIKKSINQKGIAQELEAHLVCCHGQKIISRLYCEGSACLRSLKYLKTTQTLEISLSDFIVGQKIRSNQKKIVQAINQQLKGEYVTKIRFRLL